MQNHNENQKFRIWNKGTMGKIPVKKTNAMVTVLKLKQHVPPFSVGCDFWQGGRVRLRSYPRKSGKSVCRVTAAFITAGSDAKNPSLTFIQGVVLYEGIKRRFFLFACSCPELSKLPVKALKVFFLARFPSLFLNNYNLLKSNSLIFPLLGAES